VFECEICGRRPDPETQLALERQMLDLRHGEYVDAEPVLEACDDEGGQFALASSGCGRRREDRDFPRRLDE
jgi:hypothetical protein